MEKVAKANKVEERLQDHTTERKLAGENFSNANHPSDRKQCDRRAPVKPAHCLVLARRHKTGVNTSEWIAA